MFIETMYSDPDFLMHHGIKGMKWGVRRYQNEDGTLTEEGKKKYGQTTDVAKTLSNAYDDYLLAEAGYGGDAKEAIERATKSQKELDKLMSSMTKEEIDEVSDIIERMMNTDDDFGSMIIVYDRDKKEYVAIARS